MNRLLLLVAALLLAGLAALISIIRAQPRDRCPVCGRRH
jgi:hypothetical protein